MAESEASSPELHETNQVDIDELLDQDEQDLRHSSGRGRLADSNEDQLDTVGEEELEDNTDDDENSEEAAAKNFYHTMNEEDLSNEARPPSPAPSPNPYAHPQILTVNRILIGKRKERFVKL